MSKALPLFDKLTQCNEARWSPPVSRYRQLSLATLIVLIAMVGSARAAIELADVTGGRLKGEVANGIASFKGVPFAAPPVER
jgi:hypothetical protein